MKFGLFGGPQSKANGSIAENGLGYLEYGKYVIEAERLGYSSVWLFEHHFSGFGQPSSSLNLLCYFAGITKEIRLGSAVVVLPWHNPILLAEQIGTLDVVSNGRYDLGVGRGYRTNEFHGFGIDAENAGDIYRESMDIILRAWHEKERWSYKSDRWEFNDIIVEPSPIQKPHPPLWQGAGSPESIRRAAQQGYSLLLDQILSFDQIKEKIEIYQNEIEKLGKIFDPYSIGVTRGLMFAENSKEREEAHGVRNQFISRVKSLSSGNNSQSATFNPVGQVSNEVEMSENGAIIGDKKEMIQRVEKLYQSGVRNILLHDLTGSTAALKEFALEVVPKFLAYPNADKQATHHQKMRA